MFTTLIFCALLVTTCSSLNKVLLISFDGFRYDYLDMAVKEGRNVSAFEAIYKKGFRGRVQPVMPSITFPGHFAIVTGRFTEHHGVMNNIYYVPDLNATFSYKRAADNANSSFWDVNGNEPIWITNQRHGKRTSCVYFWPGGYSSYRGRRPKKIGPVYNDSISFIDRVDKVIGWMSEDDDMSFCALYMNEPDATGHLYGPDSPEVMRKVEEMNEVLQYLLDKIAATPNLAGVLNLIVTADHGMIYVPEENKISIYDIINPDEYIPNFSNVFLGIWPKTGGSTVKSMYDRLIRSNISHVNVFRSEDIPRRFHYANSSRSPPLVLLAEPDYAIITGQHDSLRRGYHGYDNLDLRMRVLMVAAGPNLPKLESVQEILQIDIYPLICGILQLEWPNKIDGDLRRVTQLITPPPSTEFVDTFMRYAQGGGSRPGLTQTIICTLLNILLAIAYM